MTDEYAQQIYNVLVNLAGASESERERFVDYFTGKHDEEIFHEFRISGKLNPGAKFKYQGIGNVWVDYYQEHSTPAKERLADEVTAALKELK